MKKAITSTYANVVYASLVEHDGSSFIQVEFNGKQWTVPREHEHFTYLDAIAQCAILMPSEFNCNITGNSISFHFN